MNRITEGIARQKATIQQRLADGLTTKTAVKKCHKDLDMDIAEHARFQTLKTLAVAHHLLNQEEGQTVYVLLGNTVAHFNRQPVEVKAVLTRLFGELLKKRIG